MLEVDAKEVAASSRRRRLIALSGIILNTLTAGSINLFPLVSVPLAKQLGLTAAQIATLGTSAILGQYSAAVVIGKVCDLYGPARVSALAGVCFGVGYGVMGWRFKALVQQVEPRGQLDWLLLTVLFFLTGVGTAASYFSAIVASTKSFPARHAGLAIGVPCAILGLSPLFLSPLASFFTSASTNELDPGNWLLFLASLLFVVNTYGSFVIRVVPPEDVDDDKTDSPSPPDEAPTETTALLPTSADAPLPVSPHTSQPLKVLLTSPSFWIFAVILSLSLGPCEMTIASFGVIVESTLGIRIANPSPSDSRALGLRRLHVQLISMTNTVSRLVVGAVSDWLSYSGHPPHQPTASPSHEPISLSQRIRHAVEYRLRRPPRVSRLAFALGACLLLAASFGYVAFNLHLPSQLVYLSIPVGLAYGVQFTVAPAIVRSVYPVEDFGRNFGILSLTGGVGAAIFTPLLGVLVDRVAQQQRGGTCYGQACWHDIYLVSMVSALVSAVLIVFLWRRWWRGKV